jgi:two-component sensor histidine kinase
MASAIEGIGAIARRVMTLAQVYDHLLGNGLSRTIDFGSYLSSLCESFLDLEKTQRPNIGMKCNFAPIILDLDSVTALGLVVSELVANSYSHAFPDCTGTISISLFLDEAGNGATMTFSDDGVGFADKGDGGRHGLGLVSRLMEQISGSSAVRSDHGTEWTLKFPVMPRVSGEKPIAPH